MRSREVSRGNRSDVADESPEYSSLDRGLRRICRSGFAGGRRSLRPSSALDGRMHRVAGSTACPRPGRAGLLCSELECAVASRPLGSMHCREVFRRHHPTRAAAARLCVETSTVRLAARPGAREKNAEFAGKSVVCRREPSCWRKTRPICCCSLHCAPTGADEENRAVFCSRAGTPAESFSER